ncbi:M48 family metalloprotease [Burkholderia ubonensis]|uniref:hypothetical protein n=1 Tax=Burkholderia ubonensis TaxID=101571 RepID=UPI002ABE83E3|nr:hypothetical protein [Burkholderia ubonensis]
MSAIPGAKRSAQGLIIPLSDGNFFHLTNIHHSGALEGLTPDEHFYLAFCAKKEILRLREIRNSHDYLLRLRANAIVDSPRLIRVMTARKSEYERSSRPWSLTHHYHSKDHYYKSYIDQLRRENAKIVKKTPSGLMFTREVNAMCIRSFMGDVVVASECLEYFYYFMTIAFYGESLGVEIADRLDALLIAVRLILGSEALDFDIDPRGNLNQELERKVNELVGNQMKFTFGHEYAHLLCGHLAGPDMLVKLHSYDGGADSQQSIKIYSHELEYQADLYSLKNVEHNSNTFASVAQGALSMLIYLHFIDLVSDFCKLPKFSVSLTHPTPKDRIENLHRKLGRKSPYSDDLLISAFDTAAQLAHIFERKVLNSSREDLLTFYGSIYLTNYTEKIKRDRYDF